MPEDYIMTTDKDWFLIQLVEWANQFGVETGVTLNVGGVTVSGTLISGRNYFLELAQDFKGDAEDGSVRATLAGIIADHKAVYEPDDLSIQKPSSSSETGSKEADEISKDAQAPEPIVVEFVHMRDARIWIPGKPAMPTNRGVLWRGRVREIDGFFVGMLGSD